MKQLYKAVGSASLVRCILLALGLALSSSSVFALSGNYTIDPSGSGSTNYTSLAAAVSDLNSNGISGDVTFTMSASSFSGGVTISAFTGSGSYDVVFKGAGISSTTVSSTSGYCIYIDDADNITFRDMTISASSSCTRAVYVYDNAENVSIINCKVTQATTSSSTYSAIYVYGVTNYQPNYITIDSCDVQGGYYGIYIRGTSTTSSAAYRVINPTISNSTISGFYYYGAYVYYTWDAQILNNVFDGGTSTYRYSYGLLNYYCNPSSSVSKSRINGNILRNLGARGIYMSSADGYSTSNKSEMYNNVVEGNFDNVTTYSSYAYPCYMSGCDYWEIYHNTFASNNSSYSLTTTSYACLYNSGSYCDVYNNALISSGGYILYLSSSTCNADYNNYYTWSGNGSITAGGGSGANSVNINQGWSSLSSLDITDGCVNGTNLGLTTDVAGNTRNNPPDIGAYEAASGSNDAGVVEILTPKTPLTPGTQTVSIAVKNFGGNNISQVEGNYRVGSGSVVNENLAVTTPIAPCATDTFTFSNTFSMTSGCQNLMVYTTAPNGSSDPVNNNDTTQNLLGIGVSGTFTVGGSGADFSSVDAAFASLTCGGVSGPVVFLLDSGTFTGQIEVPGFAGSSSTNTVTVKGKGKGGTKLTYNQTSSGSSYTTLTFNGCSHVIFRDMTIEASNANYAYAVNFMDGDSNAVRNCDLISSTTSTSTTSVVVVRSSSNTSYSSPATSTNPIVDSCDLTGGYFGIASYGNSASHSEGLTVRNCSFKDYYTYGLYVYYTARVNIHNNYVPLGRNTTSSYAMYMYNYHASSVPDGPHFITGNTMHSGNYVYLYATDNGTGTPGEFSNNILSTTSTSYSLYFNGSSSTTYYNRNWKIYNNTVVGLSSSTYGARFYYVDEYDIRNNIFVNNAGSYAAYIYYYSPNGTNRICDNNCYYNGGSSTLVYNYATTLTTSNLNSSSSYDQNSITREVPFKATDDYHLSDACFERGAGVGLTTDIDGDTRNNPPHIGADEVPTAAIDAGIAEIITPNGTVSSGTQTVSVAIKNYGINNLSSYKASYQIGSGSVVTQSKTLSTSLNTCELDTLTFTTTFSHTSGCNQIMAWTSEPNSSTDGVSLNDTNTASYGIPMSGTYTIGGSSPDFVDFDEAFAGLNCAGISGPVVFDVRSGTYSLNRVISNISGQTASDSILFRSASSNSTMPVCEYDASTINDNYLLRFSDASYWTFDGLHLRSKNATYGRVVEFIGASSYIRFSNCKLEGVTTTTTSNYMAVVYDNTGTANQSTYITLDGNTILNGSMGIYLYGGGTGSNLQGNWTIINNQILDYYYYGGYFYYNSDLLFHNNLVSSVSGYYGLYTYYCYTNNRITNNRFMGQGSGYGLYHYYAIGSSTSPDLVANNFIQIGSGSNSAVGLYSYRCGYTGYYHNTVNNTSTYNSSSYPAGYFYYPYSAGVDIKNNIFANTGGGYAYYLEDDPTYVTADYNAVYSTTSGSYLYSYTYGAFSSLSSFSSTTGFDGNSIEANPKFYTDTDLHCITGVLDSAGTYLSAVTMDIDGDTRRNPNPSIGADEYTAIDDDAGISMINSPSVLCSSNSVSVTVGNFGEATLTSATINWSVNGTTQTPYSFTGSIASGGNSVVTIGSFNSSGSSANIVVWTTNPNGKTDLKTSNDTFSQLFNAGLSGNYTVGGSSPDYPTLSDAITAAQNIGICGSVNFLVREGTYTEQVSINPIPGADPSNTLTIKPDPSNTNPVVFEYAATTSTNNYVIAFNGCSFVTVDGLELKNTGASTTYTSVLWFAPSALGTTHHVTVQNCKLEAIPSTYTSYYGGVINMYYYFNSIYQTLEDITIKDNEIINGGSGIYCYGYSSDPYERVNISGNTIRDHGYYSVYMYYTDSATISNNRVNHGCTYTSTLYGIYCYYSDAMTANGNTVIMERPNVSPYNTYNSTMYPFAFFYCDSSVTAMNNKVSVSGNTSTYFMYASRFYYCDAGPDNRNRIINNMFTVSSSNSTAYQIGCEVYNCANTDFMHNSVSINGGPTLSTGALSMYTTVSSTIYGPMVMKNNIFHAGGSGTLALYATGLTTTSGMYDVDYNSFYGDYFGPSHYLTNSFSDYITNSGWDANSVYNDPMFDSLSNLHVNNIELYGTGTNLGITDDIDGDSRGTTPTIGAHEIDPDIEVVSVSLDTLCGAANNAVAVRMTLKNNGDINQMNIPVAFMVDAGTPVMDTITSATLPKGATMTYTLNQTADLSGAADHDVTAYSTQVVDVNRTGDTAMTTIPYWPYPMASFTHADSCLGDAMSFTSTATIALGTTSPTYWSFGDGNTSTAASPTHTYAASGSYSVMHVSTSDKGCTDTVTRSVNVLTELVAGSIGSAQTICYDFAPAMFSSSASASGSGGNYQYQWQMSSDNATWSDISGATSETYTHGTLTSSTYFRRAVTTDVGCGPAYSASVKVTVYDQLVAGTVGSDQSICYNTTPSAMTQSAAPSGGAGSFTYQWQNSTNGSSWSDIPAATTTSFAPGALKQTTWYRLVYTGNMNCGSVESNTVKITVYEDLTAGVIGNNHSICPNGTPSQVANTTAPSGGDGSYTYQWQTSSNGTSWSDISGATNSSYQETASLTSAIYYRRTTTSGSSCGTRTSNTVKVSIAPLPVSNFVLANHCFNDVMPITNNSTVSAGSITGYSWDFGDGNSSTVKTPSHVYAADGVKTVKLIVTSNIGCQDSLTKTVKVSNIPSPAFTTVYDCTTDSMNFKNATSVNCGKISAFAWDFGDGTSSTKQNPAHLYTSAGTYNVKFKIFLPGGFKDSITKAVTIHKEAVSNFTVADHCFGDSARFVNTTTDGVNYAWDFDDNNTSTKKDPVHFYRVTGTYSVTLIATDGNKCSDTTVKSVTVKVRPSAYFATDDRCVNTPVPFDNGTIYAHTYLWVFGDGSTSTAPDTNYAHTYSTAGTYNVVLYANNNNGCKDTAYGTVTVFDNPTADFAFTGSCAYDTVNFTNKSTDNKHNYWQFGDGKTTTAVNPIHAYNNAASYSVQLKVESSEHCLDSVTKTITLYSAPTPSFSASSVCEGSATSFTNTTSGGSGSLNYTWNFDDGGSSSATSPSHVYAAAGSYDVTLTATGSGACSGSVTQQVDVYAKPTVSVSNVATCLGGSVTMSASTTGATSYLWNFGDGTTSNAQAPSHTYAAAGNYTISLTVTSASGCKASAYGAAAIDPNPATSFSATNVCEGAATSFTNSSSASASSFAWDFGDGSSSSATSPAHTYASYGNYSVTLTAYTSAGCSGTATKSVQVFAKPVADFAATNECLGTTTSFTNYSTGSTSQSWYFGDGSSSAVSNTTHTYGAAGTYTVTLAVSNSNNCTSQKSSSVVVYDLPTTDFSAANGCKNQAISFTNNSSSGSYIWNFGDGYASADKDPSHAYKAKGSFSVSLKVTNSFGCQNSVTKSITVADQPTASFQDLIGCSGKSLTFSNTSKGASTFAWEFGDNNSSSATNPTHTFNNNGTYSVKLTATNSDNCTHSITKPVTIYTNPTAAFNTADVCDQSPMIFTSSSADGVHAWNFGDNITSTIKNPAHTFAAAGAYSVNLTVTSAQGCASTATKQVNVWPNPTADYIPTPQCTGPSVGLNNRSKISSGSFTSLWNYGDGNNGSANNHTYAAAGIYTITLKNTSDKGCVASVSQTVGVYQAPVAAFSAPNMCIGQTTQFTNTSSNATSATWNFGDGGSSSAISPGYRYASSGTYTVSLTAKNAIGCANVANMSVKVYNKPSASFTAPDGCTGTEIAFANKTPIYVSSLWDFGDGATSTRNNPSHTFKSGGNQTILLKVTNTEGCSDIATANITIYAAPQAAFNVVNTCKGDVTQFFNTSLNGNAFAWSFGDGNTSNITNPTNAYASNGEYSAMLIASNTNCSDTLVKKVQINALPNSGFNFTRDGRIVDFTPITPGAKTYDWDFDDGSTSNSENPTHTYQQAVVQTFNVCLRVVDQNGCINQTCDNVSIDLLNTADIQNNNIAIFPNPNNGSFSLNIGQPEGDIQIVVTDASGKTVHTVNNQLSSTQYNLQLLNAATGVYVVHVTNGGSHSSHRVMVTK